MTPYKQTKTTENGQNGNCLATSIGCLLNIPIFEIPEFEEMEKEKWKTSLVIWLQEKGFKIESSTNAPNGFSIAIGWRFDGILHAVIVKDGAFFHDPNPCNKFVEKIRNYLLITKI